jgi:hypothetical protein
MAKAVIGQPFTFTTLFVDGAGNPVTPPDPTIFAFYFLNGVQTVLVPSGTPMLPVAGDTGRFAYTLSVPSGLPDSLTLYGYMQGTDPSTSLTISAEQEVDLFNSASGGGSACGLRVSFVKPGAC